MAEATRLSAVEEQGFSDAIEQIRGGDYIDGDDLLAELRARNQGLGYRIRDVVSELSAIMRRLVALDGGDTFSKP